MEPRRLCERSRVLVLMGQHFEQGKGVEWFSRERRRQKEKGVTDTPLVEIG